MHMDSYTKWSATRQRNDAMMREAETDRLVNLAQAGRKRQSLYYQALASLGRRLVAWGCRLQESSGRPCAGYRRPQPAES